MRLIHFPVRFDESYANYDEMQNVVSLTVDILIVMGFFNPSRGPMSCANLILVRFLVVCQGVYVNFNEL